MLKPAQPFHAPPVVKRDEALASRLRRKHGNTEKKKVHAWMPHSLYKTMREGVRKSSSMQQEDISEMCHPSERVLRGGWYLYLSANQRGRWQILMTTLDWV